MQSIDIGDSSAISSTCFQEAPASQILSVLCGRNSTGLNSKRDFNIGDILKEGYIFKKGSWVKNWKKRYFILRKDINKLCYFKSKESMVLLGSISMNSYTAVLPVDPDNANGHAFAFSITNPNCTPIVLRAESFADTSSWIKAIHGVAMSLHSGRTLNSTHSTSDASSHIPLPERSFFPVVNLVRKYRYNQEVKKLQGVSQMSATVTEAEGDKCRQSISRDRRDRPVSVDRGERGGAAGQRGSRRMRRQSFSSYSTPVNMHNPTVYNPDPSNDRISFSRSNSISGMSGTNGYQWDNGADPQFSRASFTSSTVRPQTEPVRRTSVDAAVSPVVKPLVQHKPQVPTSPQGRGVNNSEKGGVEGAGGCGNGWEEVPAKEGEERPSYYYHRATRVSRWDLPDDRVSEALEDRLRASLCVENAAIAKRKHDIEKSKSEEQQNAAFAEMHAAEIKEIVSRWQVDAKARAGCLLAELLGSLHMVLPALFPEPLVLSPPTDSSTDEGASNAPSPSAVKKAYVKAIRTVHADKLAHDLDPFTKLLCNSVFVVLNQKYEKFRRSQEKRA